ncbi:unnamed protein product [Pleuronectes platessa]|uniref:Uncharacterized protein n=1 Tax=Pleuronectes platessa TaxID=8262 RepID=A0A9N7Z9W0_PLEPL|nr:unnamed protein product [Pleuronectes platessa]
MPWASSYTDDTAASTRPAHATSHQPECPSSVTSLLPQTQLYLAAGGIPLCGRPVPGGRVDSEHHGGHLWRGLRLRQQKQRVWSVWAEGTPPRSTPPHPGSAGYREEASCDHSWTPPKNSFYRFRMRTIRTQQPEQPDSWWRDTAVRLIPDQTRPDQTPPWFRLLAARSSSSGFSRHSSATPSRSRATLESNPQPQPEGSFAALQFSENLMHQSFCFSLFSDAAFLPLHRGRASGCRAAPAPEFPVREQRNVMVSAEQQIYLGGSSEDEELWAPRLHLLDNENLFIHRRAVSDSPISSSMCFHFKTSDSLPGRRWSHTEQHGSLFIPFLLFIDLCMGQSQTWKQQRLVKNSLTEVHNRNHDPRLNIEQLRPTSCCSAPNHCLHVPQRLFLVFLGDVEPVRTREEDDGEANFYGEAVMMLMTRRDVIRRASPYLKIFCNLHSKESRGAAPPREQDLSGTLHWTRTDLKGHD